MYFDLQGIQGVSADVFANFAEHREELITNKPNTDYDLVVHDKHNYCPDCAVPMRKSGPEYQCTQCGLTQMNEVEEVKSLGEATPGHLRKTSGRGRGKHYNVAPDYTKTQFKTVFTQLLQHQARYSGPAISKNILQAAATQYNGIQKMVTEDEYDSYGTVCGQKKFVRRGTIKDEILGGLIFFEGLREGSVRRKKDIAIFMELATGGFSRGESILRNLAADGKIDLPIDAEPVTGFVDRYLEALELDDPTYGPFITGLVDTSERLKLGMNSQISSKIVGAIWVLIVKKRLPITAAALERATDNTKKNTFIKFYNLVSSSPRLFAPVFAAHGVPM
jgi:ribosomal protein S27AE